MNIRWSDEKNRQLIKERGISFEMIRDMIENNDYITILDNENYINQKIFIMNIDDYIYCIPFVDSGNEIFLKTLYPSRKKNKIYNIKD